MLMWEELPAVKCKVLGNCALYFWLSMGESC